MNKTIGIIDYRAGNSPSVLNAMRRIGADAALVQTPEEAAGMSAIVLPGVGSARATMDSLDKQGWLAALPEMVLTRKLPFLGICVGMQLLFGHSEEENTDCFGWLEGTVVRFTDSKVRVPQMGWNAVSFTREHPLLEGVDKTEYFYFVNSYRVETEDKNLILGVTDYDTEFCSMLVRDNIAGAQFHLEKSGVAGLRLLKNFTLWDGSANNAD